MFELELGAFFLKPMFKIFRLFFFYFVELFFVDNIQKIFYQKISSGLKKK